MSAPLICRRSVVFLAPGSRRLVGIGLWLVLVAPGWAEDTAVDPVATAGNPPTEGVEGQYVKVALPPDQRHEEHSPRRDVPKPQHTVPSTAENVDTGKPFFEWEHMTDDWFGARPWLDDHGIIFSASATLDVSFVINGGVDTQDGAFRRLLDVNLTLDFERLVGLKGGTLFINLQHQAGEDGSERTGDIQAYSNIDADGFTEISELWYEQVLYEGVFRVKFGKVDANSEFAFVDNGAEFLNSSMGFSPTLFLLPTYPDPAMAVIAFFQPNDHFYLGGGIFDGAGQEGIRTGSRGPKTFFGKPGDVFWIGEGGARWECGQSKLAGRLAVGGWGHNGTFDDFDGSIKRRGSGLYVVFDQGLWRENPGDEEDGQGVGLFILYGWADPDISELEHHLGGGVAWIGLIPRRDDDVLGFGATWVQFTDKPGAGFTADGEIAYELFYKLMAMKWAGIKPDLQYIVNPGGGGVSDALVGTLRCEFDF